MFYGAAAASDASSQLAPTWLGPRRAPRDHNMSQRLKLPLLAPHTDSLQKCVYCPKLCRAACPIANVDGSETLTPWGKMSMAFFAARGDVPIDEPHAATAWACSTCLACRERCEHHVEVPTVLAQARAEAFLKGVAPKQAVAVADRFSRIAKENHDGVDAIVGQARPAARTVLLLGCSYVRHVPDVATDAWTVSSKLIPGELRVLRACCGAPLLQAGDHEKFAANARAFAQEVGEAERVVVVDPGCAQVLENDFPRFGVHLAEVVPLIDILFRQLDELPANALEGRKLRYHDPCHLSRSLGRSKEPRAVLARLTGAPPDNFLRAREQAECCGGGGLLPLVYPEISEKIADERIAEHRQAGGGQLVTACAQSLRRFRSRGEAAVDLLTLVAEACQTSTS